MTIKQMIQEKILKQQELINKAKSEGERSFTDDEQREFEELQREIDLLKSIDNEEEGSDREEPTDPTRVLEKERSRVTEINNLCREFGLDPSKYVADGTSIENMRSIVLEHVKKSGAPVSVRVVNDEGDKYRTAAVDGLLMRGGIEVEKPADGAREFQGMSLRDLAIESLEREGVNARRWYQKAGTVAAVDELITTVFGEGKVSEWHQYNGLPHHFKIVTENPNITGDILQEFNDIISMIKRKTAILDAVEISLNAYMNQYYGVAISVGDYITLRQEGKKPPKGYYDGTAEVNYTDPNLVSDNIKAGVSVLGVPGKGTVIDTAGTNVTSGAMLAGYSGYANGSRVEGSIPIANPDYADQLNTGTVSVGAYSGDGANYAYMYTGLNGKYVNGVNYIRHYEPYLRPEYILQGASIMGVAGAVTTGKKYASGIGYLDNSRVPLFIISLKDSDYTNCCFLRVSGLNFRPRVVCAFQSNGSILDTLILLETPENLLATIGGLRKFNEDNTFAENVYIRHGEFSIATYSYKTGREMIWHAWE